MIEEVQPAQKQSGEVFKFVPVIKSRHFGNYAVDLIYGSRAASDFECSFSYYSHEGVAGGEKDPSKTYGGAPSTGVIVAIEDYNPSEMLSPVLAGASLAVEAFAARLESDMNESPISKALAALSTVEQWGPKFRDKRVLALLGKLANKAKTLAPSGSPSPDK